MGGGGGWKTFESYSLGGGGSKCFWYDHGGQNGITLIFISVEPLGVTLWNVTTCTQYHIL